MDIRKVLSNKVLLYLVTRYITYGLQFISSILIAFKLGPELFGQWSFVLLIITIFNIVDFGISNSVSVLLVHNRENKEAVERYISSSLFVNIIISFLVIILCLAVYFFNIPLFAKYNAYKYLPLVAFVIISAYFNKSLASIYRVNNKLFEVAFYQSVIPALLFIAVVFYSKISNLWLLVGIYALGNFFSILVFIFRSKFLRYVTFNRNATRILFNKGFWLFFYNSSFYLIFYLSSVIVSIYYTVSIYGKFNFVHTLSNSVVLLIDAFSFIIFPKVIDKLRTTDKIVCKDSIYNIRVNYTTIVGLLLYGVLPLLHFVLIITPQYTDTDRALCMSAVSLVPYSYCFGINSFLIAQNKEVKLAKISTLCLLVNTLIMFILVLVFKVHYSLIYLSIIISYIIYTLLCSNAMCFMLDDDRSILHTILTAFPIRSIIPFVLALTLSLLASEKYILLGLPFVCFVVLNRKQILIVIRSIISIINSPNIVDVQ